MSLSPYQLIGEVACITGVPTGIITGRRRTRAVSRARHLVIAAVHHHHPHLSLRDLSSIVRRSCHGTAAHSLQAHRKLAAADPAYQSHAAELGIS
jgi:chromosomal replication initiation ATPase DnaA